MMMKTASIVWLTTIMVLSIVSIAAADNGPDIRIGISGIKWGAEPNTVKGPTKVYEKEGILYLRKPEETFRLKGVELGSVLFGFFENRFFAAYMRIRSRDDAEELMKILIADYGPARRKLKLKETVYIWDHHDVKIKLKEREEDAVFKLSFYYKPLSGKLNESRMDKDFEITMDLVPTR